MITETITWHELPGDGLPDADVTVLAQTRQSDGSREVWPAFWSGERWVDAGSGWAIEYGDVAAWADVPGGPQCMSDRKMAEHEAFRAAHPAP